MLKADLELSTTPQERDDALARHTAVTTRGDARSYVNYVNARAASSPYWAKLDGAHQVQEV
jgi:hypothetical protein